jgi:flagellar hook protein FlgE
MSIFGALATAISGLTSQSKALGNISDNVANSQTVGFKRVDTDFVAYVTRSTLIDNEPGSVTARPAYSNAVQGPTEISDNPLAMAISGQGMFSVARAIGITGTTPTFDERQFYTRAGDFSQDANGYLVNSSGYFLQGWPSDPLTGLPDRTKITPIQVSQQVYNPIATSQASITANLPSTSTITTPPLSLSSPIQIYDALGNQRLVTMTFTNTAADTWTMNVTAAGDVTYGAGGFDVQLSFGNAAGVAPGTLGSITTIGTTPASVTVPGAGATASDLGMVFDFGQGPQNLNLNLGTFGQALGLTQFASSTGKFDLRGTSQNGVALGSFSDLAIRANGDVTVNYDNGQSRIIARAPVVTFKNVDKLERLDGQAFMRTVESGEATVNETATNGAGKLVNGSVEKSNVDIASEFTKLIVAQRAYSANTKVVTTSDQMLQETINMAR